MAGVKIVTESEQKFLDSLPAMRVIRQARSRRTKSLLLVVFLPAKFNYQKIGLQFNGGDGDWGIICLTHRQFKRVSTRLRAYRASLDPEVFCHKCNDFTSGVGVKFDEAPPKFT